MVRDYGTSWQDIPEPEGTADEMFQSDYYFAVAEVAKNG